MSSSKLTLKDLSKVTLRSLYKKHRGAVIIKALNAILSSDAYFNKLTLASLTTEDIRDTIVSIAELEAQVLKIDNASLDMATLEDVINDINNSEYTEFVFVLFKDTTGLALRIAVDRDAITNNRNRLFRDKYVLLDTNYDCKLDCYSTMSSIQRSVWANVTSHFANLLIVMKEQLTIAILNEYRLGYDTYINNHNSDIFNYSKFLLRITKEAPTGTLRAIYSVDIHLDVLKTYVNMISYQYGNENLFRLCVEFFEWSLKNIQTEILQSNSDIVGKLITRFDVDNCLDSFKVHEPPEYIPIFKLELTNI